MAEEKEASEDKVKKSGKMGLIILLVLLLLAVGGGLAVYKFVIAPKLADDNGEMNPPPPVNLIPPAPVNYPFDMSTVNLMREGDAAAGILMYQISFECLNLETSEIIELYKPRFVNMLNQLHASRTRDEVDDILLFQTSVQRQALQKANDMLEQMKLPDSEMELKVTGVFHERCMATDAP